MLIKNVTILHCHGNRYFNIHMGFLNSNTLFSPYATEAVDVSSVDLGDVCFLRASFLVLTFCPIGQIINENVLYKETLLIPILVCGTVTH